MANRHFQFVIVLLVAPLACALNPRNLPEPAVRANGVCSESSDDIREAFFRYIFDHNASAGKNQVSHYFLAIENEADPSDNFIARFKQHVPTVRPLSEAWFDRWSAPHHKQDRKGMSQNLVFRTTSLTCTGENSAEVVGGYHEGNMSASESRYTVERRSGLWVVTSEKRNWIS